MLERLGKKTAFIGKVGKDMFGNQLKAAVEEVGIDTRALIMDEEVHTTLAFVHTYPDGDRDFSFYRNPGADMMLTKDEVPDDLIRDSRIFHFGTLSSTHEGVREATPVSYTHLDVYKRQGIYRQDHKRQKHVNHTNDNRRVAVHNLQRLLDQAKLFQHKIQNAFFLKDDDPAVKSDQGIYPEGKHKKKHSFLFTTCW